MVDVPELFKQYMEHLFAGKRCEARELIFAAHDRGMDSVRLLKLVICPAMEQIERLYRDDRISRVVEHMATRINRMIADQLQASLARKQKSGKRVVVICGDGESEELGAQITADLFEAEGWSAWFLGSQIPNDEVLQFVGKVKPDILCIYGAKPSSVPGMRKVIEMIRTVGVCQDMQILVTGGVFKRAQGLAEEIKVDLYVENIRDAVGVAESNPVRIVRPDVPQAGRRRKRKSKMTPSTVGRIRALVSGRSRK